MPIAASILHLLGGSTSSFYGGPIGSGVTVLATAGGFAYLGWVLPSRIARPAVRSVRGVRPAVAALGFAMGSGYVWLLLPLTLDPVLAVGLPLGPVAFAVAAMRAPERPTFRAGLVPGLALSAILVVPMTLVALATVTPSGIGGWEADASSIGGALAADDVANTALLVDWQPSADGDGLVTVDTSAAADAITRRFPTLRAEAWPATIVDNRMRFGPGPLVVTTAPTGPATTLEWRLPRLRDPLTAVIFVVGITPDGRRFVLAGPLELLRTPPWTGTIADWWLGR
jgi:hypothetical protein